MCNCNKCGQVKNKCIDPCNTCNEQPVSAPCLPTPCVTGCLTDTKALCTFYNGLSLKCANLNLEINPKDNIELIIQKFFTAICNMSQNNCCFPSVKVMFAHCNDGYLYINKIKKNGIDFPITPANFPGIPLCGHNGIFMIDSGVSLSAILPLIDSSAIILDGSSQEYLYYQSVNYIELEYTCEQNVIC